MIGFIGLGSMGGAIVDRLLSGGEQVVVFTQNKDTLQAFAERGAKAASSTEDVCNQAEVVIACLPDPNASLSVAQKVILGEKVKVYAELSTIGSNAIKEISDLLAQHNIEVIDAPISGGRLAVEEGTLSVMVSGNKEALEQFEVVAEQFAGKVTRVGDQVGQAQLCKLVNNSINFTAMLVSCEAVSVGVKAGIKASVLLDVVNAGTGRNSSTMDKIPRAILPRTFDLGGPLGGVVKDLDLFLSDADTAGLPRGLIDHTRNMWSDVIKEMDPDSDASNIVRHFEDTLNIEVKG